MLRPPPSVLERMHQSPLQSLSSVVGVLNAQASDDRGPISRGRGSVETGRARVPDQRSDALDDGSGPFRPVHLQHVVSSHLLRPRRR